MAGLEAPLSQLFIRRIYPAEAARCVLGMPTLVIFRVMKFWLLDKLLIASISLCLAQSWIDHTKQDSCICVNLHT